MIREVLDRAKAGMQKAVEVARDDFSSVRTGRVNPAIFQRINVDYYGSPTPLAQIAGVQPQDARTILINPYDASALNAIEKAIRDTPDLGANPSNDGKTIRVVIPELTEERRKEYVKIVKAKAEDARVVVRNLRRKAKDDLDELKSEVGDDDVARAEKELETITKDHVDLIDVALKNKESELLKVS